MRESLIKGQLSCYFSVSVYFSSFFNTLMIISSIIVVYYWYVELFGDSQIRIFYFFLSSKH